MVKALHKAGIEVILDVVFNHTGEGNHEGPTISFRGLDNSVYYHLEPYDKQFYTNLSGCGNTFNCNVPLVEKFIAECLLFWVREMHVDGFRFDLASILSRGPDGKPMDDPPVLWHIELDNELADTKIIAEAWDAGGLYQVGYFPGYRWAEWNGRFRDDVRRFVKGDKGLDRQGRRADRRQRRHLPGGRRAADQQHQLHHRPRRLHAQRPRLVQRQAQRGQRRGQPRRHGRQPELELRRRGRHRRPGDRGAARPPGPQLPDHPDALAGRPDDGHGRRGPPDPVRQQQRLLPGQRDHLVRLDAGPRSTRTSSGSPASSSPSARRSRRSGATRSSPARSTSAAWPTSRGTAAGCSARAGTTRSRGSSPSRSAASRCG